MNNTHENKQHHPNELFFDHQHLSKATLYKLLGQPHQVALSKNLEFDDLLQYAYVGLWKACTTYKPSKSKFESHAINHIRWAVKNGLNRESSTFKFNPNNQPTKEESFKLIDINSPITESDDNSLTFADTIESELKTDETTLRNLSVEELTSILTNKEKQIIHYRLMEYTYAEIGVKFGVTQQAINKNINKIIKKVNHRKDDYLIEYS